MSRLNEIKKIRYKLRNSDFLVLSKEKIEFLCDWAEKGLAAIPQTETVGVSSDGFSYDAKPKQYQCLGCRDYFYMPHPGSYCPNCGRRIIADD